MSNLCGCFYLNLNSFCLIPDRSAFMFIQRHVTRVADVKEDTLEALYEQRRRKSSQKEKEDSGIEVDPVDALPIKDFSGNLHYLTGSLFLFYF